MTSAHRRLAPALLHVTALGLGLLGATAAQALPSYEFATPALGFAHSGNGGVLVADAGAGVVQLRKGDARLIAELPAVSDVAPIAGGAMYATRGGGPGLTTGALFHVTPGGHTRMIVDLYAFEARANPHPTAVDSNPFDVELISGGSVVVADAGGNTLLLVKANGDVDWIASFPDELVSTGNLKTIVGCPTPPEGLEFACNLPAQLPAQPVSASVAVGPDGAYYVGELKGFPGPAGESRIWRVEPWALHAECGTSPDCSIVADGFTSIVDLEFGPDGLLYVTELDEASWASVEFGVDGLGGTVNACDIDTWACLEVATGLTLPIATGFDADGAGHVLVNALIPGQANLTPLP